jgi:hypothetical protein
MSTLNERESLFSERAFLERSLARLPDTARLTRRSTESRLRAVGERIARLPEASVERLRVLLTFRGKPVIGSQGIFADFGAKAVSSFNDAVAAVAASLNGGLARMGPIPNRDVHQLMITGTAVGSFGFELQAVPQIGWPAENATLQRDLSFPVGAIDPGLTEYPATGLTQALQYTHDLLQGTQEVDDERLADAASELDQRAIDKVRSFVSVLEDNGALCAIDSGPTRHFVFLDAQQVQLSVERLSCNNVQEKQVAVRGRFLGMLPGHRTFEFLRDDDGQVLSGKVAPPVLDPADINRHLGEVTTVQMTETRVGSGRPRYQLIELPQWLALPAP